MDLNTQTLDKRVYDKKTRDLIGENLLDIEKTLNALNLDFIQAFNELEKTDSAETLFGENFILENSLKSKQSAKTMTNFNTLTNGLDAKKKKNTATRDYYAPLDRLSTSSDKSLFSPKDAQKTPPTPSSSYSPQDATTLTSRGQFNFNTTRSSAAFLSPTKRMQQQFSTNQQFLSQQTRKFDDLQRQQQQQQTGHRQRSMSFTENLESKPNIATRAGLKLHLQQQRNVEIRKTGSLDEDRGSERNYVVPLPSASMQSSVKPRSVITYKPKSIRARNLRRLSYNPLNMVITSSSSSGESDMEQSIAHSECDIRSKMYPSRLQRRRQQYLNRKLHNSNSSSYYRTNSHCSNGGSNSNVNGRDKLYGSNASIKSAPHYNYTSARKKQQQPLDGCFMGVDDDKSSSSDLETDENDRKLNETRRITSVPPPPTIQQQQQPKPVQNSSNLNNIYDFVGKCFNRTYNKQPAMPKFVHGYSQIKGKFSTSNLDLLYADFDVTRLTGKSPTTKSYFDILEDPATCNKKPQIQRQSSENKTTAINRSSNGVGTFQWPEKIHGSTVKQNDLIWQLQQQHEQDMKEKEVRRSHQQQQRTMLNDFKRKSAYSSETSSTENDSLNFRQDFMPPSPAP